MPDRPAKTGRRKNGTFRKGVSGNPKGRPKGAKGFAASLKREMESTITVRENGREVKVTKAEAAAKTLVAKALKGDLRSILALAKSEVEGLAIASPQPPDDQHLTLPESDMEMLKDYFSSVSAAALNDGDEELGDD